MEHILKRVYWEVTAGCNLHCIHCRRVDALSKNSPDQLTTQQAKNLIDELVEMGKPVLILSGGEPLVRKDIYEIASYAKNAGLSVAIATNGTIVNQKVALALKKAGVYYASVSLDGATPETHDFFRGLGNFKKALRGFLNLKDVDIKVQLNFTVTRKNVEELPQMYQLANSLEAAALYLFLLVPVGCGVQIADSQMLSAQEVEQWLLWVYENNKESSIPIKTICSPHYYRIEWQMENDTRTIHNSLGNCHFKHIKENVRKGCLAGIQICFISHKGEVFPCGYLPVSASKLQNSSFKSIWENSSLFKSLREPQLLEGRCGLCSFKEVCGGCRARAYFAYGNILAEEPYCVYEPLSYENLGI